MGKDTGKVREFCQSGKVGTMHYSVTLQLVSILFLSLTCIFTLREA